MRKASTVVLAVGLWVGSVGIPALGGSPPMTAELLAGGTNIHGANGLAMDQDGRLLVASVWGREVAALDPATGDVLEHIGPTVGEVDTGGPDDVAVAPDGSICWTDILGGFVDCRRADGSVDRQFVAQGVNPIAFMPDGRLFVGLAFFGDTLYELDPMLVKPPRVVLAGRGEAPWPDQMNGFDFGPDGLLYAPQPFYGPEGGRIVRLDVDAATPVLEVVAEPVTVSSVEWDPSGTALYASTAMTGEVVRVDPDAGTVTTVATVGGVLDNMTFAPDGRLFVSDSDDGRVTQVSLADGAVTELSPGGLVLPGGITLATGADGVEHLCVADLWSMKELDPATGAILSVDRQSRIGAGITEPWTVAADGDALLITSWMSNLVQTWDPVKDQQVAAWPDFAIPVNAIRFGDDLVVAELHPASIVAQAPDGTRTRLADGIAVPSGLATTDDDLWVADWAIGAVYQIVKDGQPMLKAVATGLAQPEGLAVEPDGSLLVLESGAGRLTRILASGETELVVDGLPTGIPATAEMPPAWAFSGVTVAADGTIYLTTDRTPGIWKLTSRTAA